MLTTKLRLLRNLLIDTQINTYVTELYVIFPKFLRMFVFVDSTMSQFMDKYMENFVRLSI